MLILTNQSAVVEICSIHNRPTSYVDVVPWLHFGSFHLLINWFGPEQVWC